MNRATELKSVLKTATFRNTIFWFFDWLKGAKVRNHYTDVCLINKNHESEYAIEKRKEYLSAILQHTLKTVPYYRAFGLKTVSLDCFPVINKNSIRKHSKSFCAAQYVVAKTYKTTTSGSTGTPFTVFQDNSKRRRHKADVRFFWDTIFHPWGTKIYYLKLWNDRNKKGRLIQKIQNMVPVDVLKLDDLKIGQLLSDIKANKAPVSVLAYASALDQIVKYLSRNQTDLSKMGVISIVAMSESLDANTKEYLEHHFDCPVVSRYANLENGLLAQQTAFCGNYFLLNLASYHIEILKLNEDTPVEQGETGRIIVTDFFNRAMPMIRYDTGDLGVLRKLKRQGVVQYVLKKVEGRRMDAIYDTEGMPISSLLLSNSMWKYDELNQFQFIQKDRRRYEFILNPLADFSREKELLDEFKACLGSDAIIKITYIEEIPLLSSGKRKKVLNHMKKKPKTV
ncbi:CoF synthetase [Kriegella sp. EG-1]|nr:CoF synthetase [Flavobacteriaceae bacterium EG-1]